jgi:BirA family biotin operon repressor/biotin-[acetyl-CoA-carboxylase] ligase
MKIITFDVLESTQNYLLDLFQKEAPQEELLVVAKSQTNGIGTLNRSWESFDGNLYFSFLIFDSSLPKDLPKVSTSVYFAYILKETLASFGVDVWLKWPNDIYIGNHKVGGVITSKKSNYLVCGIGVNTKNSNQIFGNINNKIENNEIIDYFLKNIKNNYLWKKVFSNYKIEFYKNISRFINLSKSQQILDSDNIVLNMDGTININTKRICSLR